MYERFQKKFVKTLSIDNYSFIIVNESPNIILTTKIGKDFSALNNNEKEVFLKKNFGIKDLISINQKHSEKIKGINTQGNDCDGFYLKENGIAGMLSTADCIPLILWSDDVKEICGIHCGWRGMKDNIIENFYNHTNKQSFQAYIGPHISQEFYEVKKDFLKSFEKAGYSIESFLINKDEKYFFSLRGFCESQIYKKKCNILNENSLCTYKKSKLFFSHRQNPKKVSRNLCFTWL